MEDKRLEQPACIVKMSTKGYRQAHRGGRDKRVGLSVPQQNTYRCNYIHPTVKVLPSSLPVKCRADIHTRSFIAGKLLFTAIIIIIMVIFYRFYNVTRAYSTLKTVQGHIRAPSLVVSLTSTHSQTPVFPGTSCSLL